MLSSGTACKRGQLGGARLPNVQSAMARRAAFSVEINVQFRCARRAAPQRAQRQVHSKQPRIRNRRGSTGWAKRGHALGRGSAGDLAQHITCLKQNYPLRTSVGRSGASPHQVFTPLRRRHQRRIYLLVEADAGDQDLVSAELGDLPGDGL
jgi:hypothetical protein